MPIYAYRCGECGFEKDVLQKLADAPLVECPNCHKDGFSRMLTAPTFQLKGTGWYVTDFRGGDSGQPGANNGHGEGKPAESGSSEAAAGSEAKSAPADSGSSSAAGAATGSGDSHAS